MISPGGQSYFLLKKKKVENKDVIHAFRPNQGLGASTGPVVRSVAEPVEQRINIVVVFRAINLFTQRDLEEGKIVFVHSGVSTTRLLLRVSDGQKVRQGQSDSVGTGVCVCGHSSDC